MSQKATELAKLWDFFWEIARMTMDHDVLAGSAAVPASRLGRALERVDPEWWRRLAEIQ